MTAVLVVEDQQALASALDVAIGAQPDLECIGWAGSVEDALELLTRRVPDVVLMDVELPGADGIEGTRRIKAAYPDVSVLILTAGATSRRLAAAATAGASGFLAKDSKLPDILAAIRSPIDGKMVIEGTTLRELLQDVLPAHEAQAEESGQHAVAEPELNWAGLTGREREVLALMGEGLDPRTIGERLVVSLHTARGYVKNVMMKLGAHSQLEAVVMATRSGLLPGDPPDPRPDH
jgi:DNA-binding NarL/FixJ family response regulator